MIAEQQTKQDWSGAEKTICADSNGVASETQGREDAEDLYKKDILEDMTKDHDSIYKRGNEKRIRHREDE